MSRVPARIMLSAIAVGAVALMPAAAFAAGPTTYEETILDADGNNRLEAAKGECHRVRYLDGTDEPCRAKPPKGRTAIIHIGHVTDTHVLDEESPARVVEDLEAGVGDLFGDAYRPQQELEGQVVGAMAERLNGIQSPVDGAEVDDFLVTGDNTDNLQLNETIGYLTALNGGTVYPDSGNPLLSCDGKLPPGIYHGVQGAPFFSADDANDGLGYSDDESENQRTRRRSVALRDFAGLFDAAQAPFESPGLGRPSYVAFGNHDRTEQGTLFGPSSPYAFAAINEAATGCHRWLQGDRWLGTFRTLDILANDIIPTLPYDPLPEFPRPGDDPRDCFPVLYLQPCSVVPRDPDRVLLQPQEWIDLHFGIGEPDGHGFADRDTSDATYYSTSPRKGIRYVSLDTTNPDFFSQGVLSDGEFQWLDEKLTQADKAGELTFVFGHHTIATTTNICDLDPIEPQYHLGPRGSRGSCFLPQLENPNEVGESLEALLARHPSVIGYISGHEHKNAVRAHNVPKSGSFWEISTAAHIDWPQQSRLIDVFDNCDRTLSLFGTLVDHAGVPEPPDDPPLDDPDILASISREQAFNDWQGNNGEDGRPDARGTELDRNVELVTPNPYDPRC